MKNISIYEKVIIGGDFESVLRKEYLDTKVLIQKDNKIYGIVSGYGIQENTYYLKAMLYNENMGSFLNVKQILHIIDLQKEEAIANYKKSYNEDDNVSFEDYIEAAIDDESIFEKIGLDSVSVFLEEKNDAIDFFDRCKDAYCISNWTQYKKNVEDLGKENIVFTDI